jgi:hypothetical protein
VRCGFLKVGLEEAEEEGCLFIRARDMRSGQIRWASCQRVVGGAVIVREADGLNRKVWALAERHSLVS